MGRWRLRRGCSLEVIFEEDWMSTSTSLSCRDSDAAAGQKVDPPASDADARLVECDQCRQPMAPTISNDDEDEWEPIGHLSRSLSRRTILERHCYPQLQASLSGHDSDEDEPNLTDQPADKQEEEPLVSHCECCDGRFTLADAEMPQPFPAPSHEPVRRRNSTYLALACANAVSQGSMTRKVRQIFEAKEAPKGPSSAATSPVRRSDIAQARRAAVARRSNSFNPLVNDNLVIVDQTPNLTKTISQSAGNLTTTSNPSSPSSIGSSSPSSNSSIVGPGLVRCDKCSSILSVAPSPEPVATASVQLSKPQTPTDGSGAPIQDTGPQQNDAATVPPAEKKLSIVPSNREVVEEELPKPDTVKNARCLFESQLIAASENSSLDAYATLRIQNVKSNPSSKILRSESSMGLASMSLGRSPGERALRGMVPAAVGQPPAKLTVPLPSPRSAEEEAANGEDKSYVIAVGRMNSLRWPSRKDHVLRSPSPPVNRPQYGLANSKNASSHRSNPTLYQRNSTTRSSRRSTDVESLMSEASDWSSDLESEVSFGGSSTASSTPFPTHEATTSEGRYISPEILDKIRSYGMTLVFIDGKMVDQSPVWSADQEDEEGTTKTTRSAGQSQGRTTKTLETVHHINHNQTFSATPDESVKGSPRIVACLPKSERHRHSSGESVASSGFSSARSVENDTSADSIGGESTKTIHDSDNRSPSPAPIKHPSVKSIASSPFGTYSVVYNFQSRTPMFV